MAGMKAVFNCFITFPLTVRLVMGRTKLEHEKTRMKINKDDNIHKSEALKR